MHYSQLFAISCSLFLLAGCGTNSKPSPQNPASAAAITPEVLSPEIAETSGLACADNDRFFTINDSGNSAVVYQLDPQGRITQRFTTDAKNQDWEAISLHQGQLWIADIGNNSGQRTSLQLYRTEVPEPRQDQLKTAVIELYYPEPRLPVAGPYQHELDAEALVSTGKDLLMFSKNWQGQQSRVYRLDVTNSKVMLQPSGLTDPLPGLITDVAYAPSRQLFIAAGYKNIRLNPLAFMLTGKFEPFLAVLDAQYRLVKTVKIEGAGQLEGICLDKADNIWLSQEGSTHHAARFWRWGNLANLLAVKD